MARGRPPKNTASPARQYQEKLQELEAHYAQEARVAFLCGDISRTLAYSSETWGIPKDVLARKVGRFFSGDTLREGVRTQESVPEVRRDAPDGYEEQPLALDSGARSPVQREEVHPVNRKRVDITPITHECFSAWRTRDEAMQFLYGTPYRRNSPHIIMMIKKWVEFGLAQTDTRGAFRVTKSLDEILEDRAKRKLNYSRDWQDRQQEETIKQAGLTDVVREYFEKPNDVGLLSQYLINKGMGKTAGAAAQMASRWVKTGILKKQGKLFVLAPANAGGFVRGDLKKLVLELLDKGPLFIREVAGKLGLDVRKVNGCCVGLMRGGHIKQIADGRVVKQ